MASARKAQVFSDAAYAILTRPAASHTGHSLLCVDVLVESGVTDLSVYNRGATR